MTETIHQPNACVAVFERQPFWGPELQRQFQQRNILVRECRSINDLVSSVKEFSANVALIVLDAAPTECLQWLSSHLVADCPVPCVVIASAEFRDFEWVIREAGGDFVDDEIGRTHLARLCVRHLRRSL